jgi:hypothetical protein
VEPANYRKNHTLSIHRFVVVSEALAKKMVMRKKKQEIYSSYKGLIFKKTEA